MPASPLQGSLETCSKPRVPEPAIAASFTLGFAASHLRCSLLHRLQLRIEVYLLLFETLRSLQNVPS